MSGFVYIWFDKKHKRYYIGAHWGDINDGYICSSSWMKQAYRHRPQDFKRRVIKIVEDRSELYAEESRWLNFIPDNQLGKQYYNLCKNSNHWHNNSLTDLRTTKEKIRQKALTRYQDMLPEERSKIAHKPEGFGKAITARQLGVPKSPEHRAINIENLKKARKVNKQNKPGFKLSSEHNKACHAWERTPEIREKMRQAALNRKKKF